MERLTIAGESPLFETKVNSTGILSSAGHVEPRVNLGGPSPKAKYYLMTDSA